MRSTPYILAAASLSLFLLQGQTRPQAATIPVEAAATTAPALRAFPRSMPSQYNLLTERSIFSRERLRSAYIPRRSAEPSYTPRVRPDTLTGVVRDGDEFVAFLEDGRTGRTGLVRVGQTLADGVVETITFDALFLRSPGSPEPHRIEVGRTLVIATQSPPTTSSAATSTAPAETAPSDGAATAPSTAAPPVSGEAEPTDPVERLKWRRRKELEGK